MKVYFYIVAMSFASGCQCSAEYFGEANKISSQKSGEASLLEAKSAKKIAIESAKAELEAAKLKSLAEIERAKGVAEANKIIGDSLKGNESYLKYLWINNMNKEEKSVIYVPTEAGLPILEAGKRK